MEQQYIHLLVKQALAEDIGSGDCSASLIPPSTRVKAVILAREPLVVCGMEFVNQAFHQLDSTIQIDWHVSEGDMAPKETVLCTLQGGAQPVLSAERTALNFLQTLSGTATFTRDMVNLLKGTSAILLDTRKTIPGLRQAQKYAVRVGGAQNHRMGLYDAVLLKENHLRVYPSIKAAVLEARKRYPELFIEVEVETLGQLKEALTTSVNRILLDNFSLDHLKQAVKIAAGRIPLEVSGGVTPHTLRAIAETGVDYISMGALTKHVRAIDLSLRFL